MDPDPLPSSNLILVWTSVSYTLDADLFMFIQEKTQFCGFIAWLPIEWIQYESKYSKQAAENE